MNINEIDLHRSLKSHAETTHNVITELSTAIDATAHKMRDKTPIEQSSKWVKVSKRLIWIEKEQNLASEKLAPLISTVNQAVIQAKSNLIASIEPFESKQELQKDEIRQIAASADLLLSNPLEGLFPEDQTLQLKIESTIGWIDARAQKDNSFLLSLVAQPLLFPQLSTHLEKRHPKTAAYRAVLSDNNELLKEVLEKEPALVNASIDEKGNTLLHLALKRHANPLCLPILLEYGASLDTVNNKFCLPMDSTGRGSFPKRQQIEQMLPPLNSQISNDVAETIETLFALPTSGIHKVKSAKIQRILEHLRNYPDWVKEHPNFTAIMLSHAIQVVYPYSQVIESLSAFADVIVDQRAKMLFQHAIYHGRIEIADFFLNLGMDCSQQFEGPLQHPQHRGKTPLEQAVLTEKFDIAKLMLQRGHQPPPSLLDQFAQRKDASNYAWRWMLNVIPDKKMMQSRLVSSIAKKEWGEILCWINKGLVPNEPHMLVLEAIEAGQYYLVEVLWQSGLLNQHDLVLRAVAKCNQPSWALNFFEMAKSSGCVINRPEFLRAAVEASNIPLAALLVAEGASCTGFKYENEIRNFASYLNESAEERAFRLRLSEKNLAHLVGDSFVRKMKDDSGTSLEGDCPSNSLNFLSSAIRYAGLRFPLVQKQMGPILERARKYALRLESLAAFKSSEELADALQDLEQDILAEAEELAVGQSLSFPGGWPGHAIAYVITKLPDGRIQLKVINTGSGLIYHTSAHDGSRRHANTVSVYELTMERLTEARIIQALLESRSAYVLEGTRRRFRAPDIYHTLHPYKTSEINLDESLRGWRKPQLAGTCSLRCLLAFLKTELPLPMYKEVTDTIKEDAVYFTVQQYEPLVAHRPALRKFLSLAIPHLFDTFWKRLKTRETAREGDTLRLTNLQAASERLKRALPPLKSDHEPLSLEAAFNSKSKEIASSLERIAAEGSLPPKTWGVEVSSSLPPTLKPLALDKVTTTQDLVACLANLMEYSTHLSANDEEAAALLLSTELSAIGRTVIAERSKRPDSFNKVMGELENNPDLCEQLIQQITDLTVKLQKNSSTIQKVDPSRFIATQYALAMALSLTKMMENARNYPESIRITTYGVAINPQEMLENGLAEHCLLNAEWENDLTQLMGFDWSNKKEPLFNLANHMVQGDRKKADGSGYLINLRLTSDLPEFKYAAEIAKSFSTWDMADSQLKCELDRWLRILDDEPYIDLQEWRIHWLYANNKVPLYFQNVRKLTIIASLFPPGHLAPSDDKIEYAIPKSAALFDAGLEDREDGKTPMQVSYATNIVVPFPEPTAPMQQIDGLQVGSQEQEKKTKLALIERSQNRAICSYDDVASRRLMSIRSMAISTRPVTELSVPLLIDHYAKNLDDLAEPYQQAFFEATLFAASRFPLSLRRRVQLETELQHFFIRAIQYFDDRIQAKTNIKPSIQATVFLTCQHARFLSYSLKNGIKLIDKTPTDELIKTTRAKLRSMLAEPLFASEEMQHYLHLALLDTFQVLAVKDSNGLLDIARSISQLNLHSLTEKNSLPLAYAFVASATSVPVQQAANILAVLKREPETAKAYLNRIAETFDITSNENVQWEERAFPLYHCKMGGSLIEVNCLSGAILKDGKELIGTPKNIRSHSSYFTLFGKRHLNMTVQPLDEDGTTLYTSQDLYGPIHIVAQHDYLNSIHRLINGRWCAFVDSCQQKTPPVPPLSGVDTLLAWRSLDDNTFFWADRNTMLPIYKVDSQGHFTLLQTDPEVNWEWVDLAKVPGGNAVKILDPSAFLLQEVSNKKSRQMRLQLPHVIAPNGDPLEFTRSQPLGYPEERWIIKGLPHLFLSDNQEIPGLQNFQNYLVLEAGSGEREALLPIKTFDQLRSSVAVQTSCIRVQLKEDSLQSHVPYHNLYLAYLTLTHATTPNDYRKAIKFLQEARKFERYDETELQMISNVILSQNMTKDHTGYTYACRLYASWLVQDNLKRNPLPTTETESQILAFFEGRYTRNKGNQIWSFNHVINKAAEGYFERCQHLPADMRIENCISRRELQDWELYRRAKKQEVVGPESITPPDSKVINSLVDLLRFRAVKVSGDLVTRPTNNLKQQFPMLLDKALSNDPQKKQLVLDRLQTIGHDPDTDTRNLATILDAALNIGSSVIAREIITYTLDAMAPNSILDPKELNAFTAAVREYGWSLNYPKSEPACATPPINPAPILPSHEPLVIPQAIPASTKLPFIMPSTKSSSFDSLLAHAFNVSQKDEETTLDSFHLETNDLGIKAGVEELNEDYAEGIRKNNETPSYTLSGRVSVDQLTTIHRQEIAIQAGQYEDAMQKKKDDILSLANKLPSDPLLALQHQTSISSGRKQPITIRDCITLFLRGDEGIYRQKTHLENDEDIASLHQDIGEYIHLHNQYQRHKAVVSVLDELAKKGEQPALIQHLAEELNLKQAYDPNNNTNALMVFEYSQNLYLHEHQVQGIQDMTEVDPPNPLRFRSKLLQRIQGGGKSLVFGHVMALLKADGYHLSVHVPPTAQYQTALYDMAQTSDQIFSQREQTLVFDDDPLKYTAEYLSMMRDTMQEAVINREYITVTTESLRAMRCKYLKSRFLIRELPDGPEKNALRESTQILKEMLSILRSRGVFTFDEVHIALDPIKELNMPYGKAVPPDMESCKLINKILCYACSATDDHGQRLLDINHSSQQTDAQRKQMKEVIIARLAMQQGWEDPAIADFLSGVIEDIPYFLEGEENRPQARLVTLAKQMLHGNWLEERLQKNVNEDHGLPTDTFPRISIPFIANMKPAKGSDFSDEQVIITNTFIAYLAEGLDKEQTRDCLLALRKQAFDEKEAKQDTDPTLSIQNTEIANKFKRAFGITLFSLDTDNPESIDGMQHLFLHKNEEAIDILLEYVSNAELSHVELYEHQVCSNGQNTASMSQSNVGYSGSMEDLNMAPIGTEIKPEKGTNGQTIDRLIRQGTQTVLVNSQAEALFTELLDKHPLRDQVRAFIDTGAHFRGLENEAVAAMTCMKMREYNSQVQGVLFYHSKTDKLCFMHRDTPGDYIILSGSTPKTIAAETGYKPEQLFTYFDQDHITGSNIAQMANAIAIVTVKDDTEEFTVLQGSRRMRGLDRGQKIIVAISRGAMEKISQTIQLTACVDTPPTIKETLLFTRVQMSKGQKPKNLMFALQKIEDAVQQLVLDSLYSLTEAQEEELFNRTAYLFDKSVVVNLYREYAHKRENIPIKTYFEGVINSLTDPLKETISDDLLIGLRDLLEIEVLNAKVLAGIQAEISVSKAKTTAINNPNREITRVQYRQQERREVREMSNAQHQENVNEYMRQVEAYRKKTGEIAKEIPLKKQAVENPTFGTPNPQIDLDSAIGSFARSRTLEPTAKVWSLNQAVQTELSQIGIRFDERLMTTSNASIVRTDRSDLLGPYRKAFAPLLLICDGENDWKAIRCSDRDTILIDGGIRSKAIKLPPGRKMFLVRSNGKPIASTVPREDSFLENPHVQTLLLQAMFFEGDYKTLSRNPWSKPLEKWLTSIEGEERAGLANFFEKHAL
ncbi:MAG: ankyrin repeat domain-containing protein, partial [Chlamydiales bacterium]|nr:ankyrin repeat domain-containing protein [Chlamydiales bacterium]